MRNFVQWNKYVKGEAVCYSWKLDRVQVKITDEHYLNNFVDYVCNDNAGLLRDFDKIILLGDGNPIAIYPNNSQDLSDVKIYLESVKGTDIHTIVLSIGEYSSTFVDAEGIDATLGILNSVTKIQVRYMLNE